MKIYGQISELVKMIMRKSGKQYTVNPPATDGGAGDKELYIPNNPTDGDSLVLAAATQALTNKTIAAGSNTITGLTNANLDAAALIDWSKVGASGESYIRSGSVDPTSSATTGVKGSLYLNNSTGFVYRKLDNGSSTNWRLVLDTSSAPGQVITVGTSGCNYTTITAALNAITDAAINKQYLIMIYPGTYSETLTAKSYVHMLGMGSGTTVLVTASTTVLSGTVQDDAFTACANMTFLCTPTTDNQSAVNVVGSIGFSDCFYIVQTSSNVTMNGITLKSAATGITAIKGGSVQLICTYAGSTKTVNPIKIESLGQTFVTAISARVSVNQNSGSYCGLTVTATSTGELGIITYGQFVENASVSSASWTVSGACVYSATSKNRVIGDSDWRITSAGGGTFTAMLLNSSSAGAQMFYEGMSISASGFTAGSYYMTDTAVTDTQKVWLNAPNRDMGKTGAGLAIITPYDELKSGFVEWGSGSTYWTYNAGSRLFSVDRRISGVVKSSPVIAASAQSTTLTNFAVNWVYIDSSGTIGSTTSVNEALYRDNVVLFEVYSDGTNYIVCKENHPYKFTTAISHAWHRLFGPLLEGTGAQIAVLSGAGRTIDVQGADVLTDHGLDTTIPDSTGVAVSWTVAYTGASGLVLVAPATALPGQYNNGTALNNTSSVVAYRLGVAKDSLNSSSPQYIARPHTATFANVSAARTACNANAVALFDTNLKSLEIVQLGFAIITGNGSGGGTLNEVIVSKQTFAANFAAAAASSSANLVNTVVTNFGGILSASDTTVQLALDTIDNHAATSDLSHSTITSYLDQAVKTTSNPTFTGITMKETGGGTDTVTLKPPASVTTSYNFTLPGAPDNGKFLTTDASGNTSWSTPAGAGDVTGPGSAVSGNLATFNGTTGKVIQDSGYTLNQSLSTTSSPTFSDLTLTGGDLSFTTNTGTAGVDKIARTASGTLNINNGGIIVSGTAITLAQATTVSAGAFTASTSTTHTFGGTADNTLLNIKSGAAKYAAVQLYIDNVVKGQMAVAGGGDQFVTGSVLNDLCINAAASANLLIGIGGTKIAGANSTGAWTLQSTAGRHYIQSSFADVALQVYASATSNDGNAALYIVKQSTTNTTAQALIQFAINAGATGQGQINGNGANAAAFGSFSDRRLKDNIQPLTGQLAKIMRLKPSSFTYKACGGYQEGFIAQEMQDVYPDSVSVYGQDGMLGITGWDKTSARLVAAIQELKAEIDALKAQLNV